MSVYVYVCAQSTCVRGRWTCEAQALCSNIYREYCPMSNTTYCASRSVCGSEAKEGLRSCAFSITRILYLLNGRVEQDNQEHTVYAIRISLSEPNNVNLTYPIFNIQQLLVLGQPLLILGKPLRTCHGKSLITLLHLYFELGDVGYHLLFWLKAISSP